MSIDLARLATDWWSWIAPLSVQIAVLGIVFALADRCLLRRSAVRVRAALTWAFLARLVLPPELASPVALARILPPVSAFEPATELDPSHAAFAVWLAGVLLAAAVLALASTRQRAACLRATRAADEQVVRRVAELAAALRIVHVPRVLVSTAGRGPAIVGLLRPVLVIPAGLGGARLDHALLHELAHVARRDPLASLAWSVARAVFWFHPVVHWAAAHAALLREIACDERAVRVLGRAAPYRATLVEMAGASIAPRATLVTAFAPAGTHLLARALALDHALAVRAGRARAQAAACFLVTLVCVVPLARPRVLAIDTPVQELEGCLQKRMAVLAALAAQESAGAQPTSVEDPR